MQPQKAAGAPEPDRSLIQALTQLEPHYWASGLVIRGMAQAGIADSLADGPRTAAAIAEACSLHAATAARFLRACETVGMIERIGDGYCLTQAGQLLRSDIPSLRGFVISVNDPGMTRPWERLAEALTTGKSPARDTLAGRDFWEHLEATPAEAAAYAECMVPTSRLAGETVVAALPTHRFSRVVDVGGSPGSLIGKVLAAAPDARGVVLDLPWALPYCTRELDEHGVADRVELVAGDFFDDVPAGGDLYVLKNILVDWEDADALRILGNCRKAAAPGARLLVIDWALTDYPSFTHVNDIDALLVTGGRIRTEAEQLDLLSEAGFQEPHRLVVPGQEGSPMVLLQAAVPE
ncbi:methyltransferase [Actinoplanes sp. N902-109]|uniref:methyltransferase n=1 Tax=Actinoplanes sp. (strain N902-109) TaxID=649831 RepID=UPI0003293AA7|nr:methyltransferase [Actinoplanes sp. N902-109]AGL16636.1 O-methyltransferase, family 2 [Actinoplanes sp. N902-109]